MIVNYKGKDIELPLNAYYIYSDISEYEYTIEVYQVEIIDYQNSTWKFRYLKNIWNGQLKSSKPTTETFEVNSLDNLCFDLYSLKSQTEYIRASFKVAMSHHQYLLQNQLEKITGELKDYTHKQSLLKENLTQLTNLNFPEIQNLYKKINS